MRKTAQRGHTYQNKTKTEEVFAITSWMKMNVNDMKMGFRRIDLIWLFGANYYTFIITIIIITIINFDLAHASLCYLTSHIAYGVRVCAIHPGRNHYIK